MPILSKYFEGKHPSPLRLATIEFAKRSDNVKAINTAIGNVSLPMHPAMKKRMFNLDAADSPFKDGVDPYTLTVGTEECQEAFLNAVRASGFNTDNLHVQITDGASAAMEMIILGCCGPPKSGERPLLVIDPSYTNYKLMADRTDRKIVSMKRKLQDDGKFTLPDLDEIKSIIEKHKPGAMVVIPYDNPTGHFYDQETMIKLAKICVEHDLWMISDEAYRELFYTGQEPSSIWGITNNEVPGIEGKRIGLDTSSKVWNACGLRIGAIITDNEEIYEKSVAEYTANLSPNSIGQYIFGAIAHEKVEDLQKWFEEIRGYYKDLMADVSSELKNKIPDLIVSSPDSAIYSVLDVRKLVDDKFNAKDFVLYCAKEGKTDINGESMTLLVAPMDDFYNMENGDASPGRTQMRIAYVAKPEEMKLVPELFSKLFEQYSKQ